MCPRKSGWSSLTLIASRGCSTTAPGGCGTRSRTEWKQAGPWTLTSTNLIGSIQMVRAALPRLRAQGGGRIIQLSTYGGQAAFPGGSLYHASKWGIEGFIDAVGQEVAPFNIGCTLVEPGGARTEFRFGGAKLGPKMYAYADTPAGMTRAMLQDTSRLPIGDPAKMVKLMIDSVEQNPAPKRIVLGSDSYTVIQKSLAERLAAVEAQKDIAFSTDFPKSA